ncbi:hypothetical protein [Nonomuraea africana]|uniref:hypothetical protein n=1 Tax=Nonomuraea africana TaxID=46171 RepID=UPI0034064B99
MADHQPMPETMDEDVIDLLLAQHALISGAVTAHARSEERYEFMQLRAHTSAAERRTLALGVKAFGRAGDPRQAACGGLARALCAI